MDSKIQERLIHSVPQPFEYIFQVRLHDTDAAGVLFFAHLLRYAHDAYEAYLAESRYALNLLLNESGSRLPLVHAAADYRLPLRHGEQVTVRLSLARLGSTAFTLDYAFFTQQSQPVARARTVHVAVDPNSGQAIPLPITLRTILSQLVRSVYGDLSPCV